MPRDIIASEQHARRLAQEEAQQTEEAAAPIARTERHRKVAQQLDTATEESLLFLTKAFRGEIPMDEIDSRVLLGAANATLSAWSRLQATEASREQTELVRAGVFARDLGGKATDYIGAAPKPKLAAVNE